MHHLDILGVFSIVEVPFLASGRNASQDEFGKLRVQGCPLVVLYFYLWFKTFCISTVTDLVFLFWIRFLWNNNPLQFYVHKVSN